MTNIVIVAAKRTPVGSFNGSFAHTPAHILGSVAIKAALDAAHIPAADVDQVILGQVLCAAQGQNPARQASIDAGLSIEVPAWGINQVCGSGLRAVISGFQSIKLGESKKVISGGQENMSRTTHALFYREDKKLIEKGIEIHSLMEF